MASCHSIMKVQGQLIGDPLELKMFESTNLILDDNNQNKFDDLIIAIIKQKEENEGMGIFEEIGIIRRFEFSSSL